MGRTISMAIAAVFLLFMLSIPGEAVAKKGGIGKGGGTRDEILYHSHSDRSYSGKEQFKGKGHAHGRDQHQRLQEQGRESKIQIIATEKIELSSSLRNEEFNRRS